MALFFFFFLNSSHDTLEFAEKKQTKSNVKVICIDLFLKAVSKSCKFFSFKNVY